LRDVTPNGCFIETAERWYIGTVVLIVLQKEGTAPAEEKSTGGQPESIPVRAKVVSHGEDGVYVHFTFLRAQNRTDLRKFLKKVGSEMAMSDAIGKNGCAEQGEALLELAFLIPVTFFLIGSAISLGSLLSARTTVARPAAIHIVNSTPAVPVWTYRRTQ
jgi:hypothetical protein